MYSFAIITLCGVDKERVRTLINCSNKNILTYVYMHVLRFFKKKLKELSKREK